MPTEISTGKTVFILAAVVGCFAVLWPRLFHPMLQSAIYEKSPLENTAGCCDVISDMDVNAMRILKEMCGRILTKHDELDPKFLSDFEHGKMSKDVINTCKREVLNTCGVDITSFLAEQVGLGQTYRQILDNIKTFNNSVCLKQHFGLERSLVGAARHWSHSSPKNLRQERPPHMRPDLMHAALRERGRAIPQSNVVPRILEGRPGPIPGMRPPMGGAGHVVPPPKATQGALGILMPLYTIGIVMIFVYTMMKLLMRRNNEAESVNNFQSDPNFRHYVFADQHGGQNGTNKHRYDQPTKLVETAISGLLAEVDRQRENVAKQADQLSGKGENGLQAEPKKEGEAEQEAASVKVVNMETTASCEGGKPWTGSRPSTPTASRSRPPSRPPTPLEREAATIPPPQDAQEIYLEGALPSQAQLLVSESETEAHKVAEDEVESTNESAKHVGFSQDSIQNFPISDENNLQQKLPTDKKKNLSFAFCDEKSDEYLEEDVLCDSDADGVKLTPRMEGEQPISQQGAVDENQVPPVALQRLKNLDEDFLLSEIDDIIEEAVQCVRQELNDKQNQNPANWDDDEEEEVEKEEEILTDGEDGEEGDEYGNDIESDIRDALKESEKMRKSVHEKVEEVKLSLAPTASFLNNGVEVNLSQSKVKFADNSNDISADKVQFFGDKNNVDGEEEEVIEEEEVEVEEEELDDEYEEEVDEEEEEEEVEEEEEEEDEEVDIEEAVEGKDVKPKLLEAAEKLVSDDVKVDHDVEYDEDEETEEEEEEEEEEEDVDEGAYGEEEEEDREVVGKAHVSSQNGKQ